MNRKTIDWSIIRGALISVILSLIISGSLVSVSYYFKDKMKRENNRNNAVFMNISQRYLAIDDEKEHIKNFYPEFIKLYHSGVIGREQRLNWIEVLSDTGSDIKLPSLSYTINSQTKYTPAYSINLGRFQLYTSEMSLKLGLLHAGDLFNLLDGMNEKANGFFSVNDCKFSSSGSIVLDQPGVSNITVDCNINWYTIKLADGSEIQV